MRCRTVSSLCLTAPVIPSWMLKVWSSSSTSSMTAPDLVCRCKLFCVCVCVCVSSSKIILPSALHEQLVG